MINKDIEDFSKRIKGKIIFDYSIKKLNWFNIGGITKIFFKPDSLVELVEYLKLYNKRGKIFILGAGSNTLFSDNIFEGTIIKLGNNFSKISKLNELTLIAGSATLDKKISEFAKENEIGGFEFLSGIPGTIGGGIRMNSGCFNREFKDITVSVQLVDYFGKIFTINSNKINFSYRSVDFPKDYIFLSATLKGYRENKKNIENKIEEIKNKKEIAQPSKIKTGGSTFKNPINQTDQKAWELIKKYIPINKKFGDAAISEKHSNFFVNKGNATSKDMRNLIDFVKKNVEKETGIIINTEIVIVD
tara:strand:+ start:1832 stop:2740 length:909 start_codon:yes stop_codon:yes gene_type:complete